MAENVSKKKAFPAKGLITAVILAVISVTIFWLLQRLLMPKYQKGAIEGSFTEEYYKEKVPPMSSFSVTAMHMPIIRR